MCLYLNRNLMNETITPCKYIFKMVTVLSQQKSKQKTTITTKQPTKAQTPKPCCTGIFTKTTCWQNDKNWKALIFTYERRLLIQV